MNVININGGTPLYGEMSVGGSKNAIPPILAACILTDEKVTVTNVPKITDVDDMLYIMRDLGVKATSSDHSLTIDCSNICNYRISNQHVGKIRSSVILLGAVIARFSCAIMAHPGGCDIGARPIDMHLDAFRQMGVDICYENDCWLCNTDGLKGANITLPFPSVGATENIILAAAMANGETLITNAAREPEIVALQDIINLMGGDVQGAGTNTIRIVGKKHYHGCEYTLIPDRIVAGTYMLAVCATGGDVVIKNAVPAHNSLLIDCIKRMGADCHILSDNSVRVMKSKRLCGIDYVNTLPFPGFPTDLQPQLMSVLCLANGRSVIRESIYESRFKAAQSLCSLGADIKVTSNDIDGHYAVINGVNSLKGAEIFGTDLRCNAALVIAGLAAHGNTKINNAHFISRGYEDIVGAFSNVGANISEC